MWATSARAQVTQLAVEQQEAALQKTYLLFTEDGYQKVIDAPMFHDPGSLAIFEAVAPTRQLFSCFICFNRVSPLSARPPCVVSVLEKSCALSGQGGTFGQRR